MQQPSAASHQSRIEAHNPMGIGISRLALLLALSLGLAASALGQGNAGQVQRGITVWKQGAHTEAVSLWQPLAEQGDADAQLFLGFAYKTGRGVVQDAEAASRWYRRAAAQGLPEAQWELGLRYELGIGVQQDTDEAARWYGLATRGDFCPADLPAGGRLGDD